MIKRSKKTIAILLSLLTISSVTGNTLLYKPVYAAESSDKSSSVYTEDQLTSAIETDLESYLKEQYDKKYDNVAVVKIDLAQKKTIPLKNSKISEVTLYGYGVVSTEGKVIGKGYVVGGALGYALHDSNKNPIYIQADTLDTERLNEIESAIKEAVNSIENKVDSISKYDDDQLTEVLTDYLEGYLVEQYNKKDTNVSAVKIDLTQKKTIPLKNNKISEVTLYGYGVVNSEGEVIGKGYIVGGKVAYILKEANKDPIYISADKLDSQLIGNLKDIIDGKLGSISGKIDDILSDFKSTTGDLSDSLKDLSDSLNDKSDDVDDAWDKVFDRFDNDEGWGKRDGYKYYYDEDGVSLKGVQKINGKTYYFNRIDGAMETGWQIVDGKRCYFDKEEGYQIFDTLIEDGEDKYYVGADGVALKSAWATYNGKNYYLKANGKAATSWIKIGDYWYYFESDGSMATSSWKYSKDKWYYLKDNGALATDWLYINGGWYCFSDPSGALKTGWFRKDGSWYCSDSNGKMKTGWVWSTDGWSYLDDTTGKMKKNEWVTVDGKKYYFNINGIMTTGKKYINGEKYIFNSDGSLA